MILQDVCDKDAESRDVLVKNYFFKVVDWMKEYEGQGVAYMDLVQEANLVVMDELNRRDWMKELDAFDVMDSVDVNAWIDLSERLDDYLKAAIRVVVDGLVDEQTSERMAGNRVAKVVNRVNDAANEAYAKYGRKVTVEELAQFMQEPLEVVKEALQLSADKIENVVAS
jgi:DNA-directed RNA polymerase sigma subunit (sigma70/sigma32)